MRYSKGSKVWLTIISHVISFVGSISPIRLSSSSSRTLRLCPPPIAFSSIRERFYPASRIPFHRNFVAEVDSPRGTNEFEQGNTRIDIPGGCAGSLSQNPSGRRRWPTVPYFSGIHALSSFM